MVQEIPCKCQLIGRQSPFNGLISRHSSKLPIQLPCSAPSLNKSNSFGAFSSLPHPVGFLSLLTDVSSYISEQPRDTKLPCIVSFRRERSAFPFQIRRKSHSGIRQTAKIAATSPRDRKELVHTVSSSKEERRELNIFQIIRTNLALLKECGTGF